MHLLIFPAFELSDPPPIKPYIYGIGSSSTLSTLTIGQQPLFAGLPKSAAKYAASLQNTLSTTPRSTPQNSYQRSEYTASQTTLQDLSSAPTYHRPDEQKQGRQNEFISQNPSRKSTGPSEPSPLPIDPHPYEYDKLRDGQPGQVYGHAVVGVRKSRTDLPNTPGDRNRSRRDVSDQYSREQSICDIALGVPETLTGHDPNRDSEGNDEGKYGSDRKRGSGSRTLLFDYSPSTHLTSIKALA